MEDPLQKNVMIIIFKVLSFTLDDLSLPSSPSFKFSFFSLDFCFFFLGVLGVSVCVCRYTLICAGGGYYDF